MHSAIDAVLEQGAGVASRERLQAVITRGQLDREVRSGHLVAVFRGAYVRPWDVDTLRDRAALVSVGAPAAAFGPTALDRHGLLTSDPAGPDRLKPLDAVHVLVGTSRAVRGQPGLVVHRTAVPRRVTRVDGVATETVVDALVSSWPMLRRRRREVVIAAVRTGRATAAALRAAESHRRRLVGRAELRSLLDLLAAGCESELEIWGLRHVFDAPGLSHGVRQHEVGVGGRRCRLDLAFVAERVAVEVDGAAYHFGREARERDMRRDAALLSMGWLVLRFSHRRLHDDPAGCRRDLVAVLATRQRPMAG